MLATENKPRRPPSELIPPAVRKGAKPHTKQGNDLNIVVFTASVVGRRNGFCSDTFDENLKMGNSRPICYMLKGLLT